MADNLVPGIPYVHLRWDDSYVYYYQPIPVKFEAADLITKVQAEDELKDAGVDVSSEGITGYTITRNVIYNTLLNSFQLRPDFLVTGTRLSDIEIISPRDNRRIIDGEGHDVWIENSIGGEIPVIEMSLPCTNEEYLGTNVPVNSVVMTDTQGMGFSVAFKFYDTPVEVKKRLQSEIYREVDERYKQPVLLVDMRVKRRDYTSGRETYVWFELRYYVDGRVVLLKFGETVEDFYKKFIERYPWLALILSRQSSVWATSFTSFDLKYAKNLDKLFGVASATWEGWNQSTLGKVFHTIYCQVIDDTLTIHPLPQKELIWDKGIKASLVTKEEEVKNKSNISWCFDEIDLGCTFSSIVFYLSKAYFKSGYVGSFPHVVDKVFGKELNVTTYQGCVSNGPGDLERYIIPRLVSREVLYSNLERYEFNLSLLTNTENTVFESSATTPLFRSVIFGGEETAISPYQPSWWPEDFVLMPTSFTGEETITERRFTLAFYFPPDTQDEYLLKLRDVLGNMKGVYPVVLEFGRMNSQGNKVDTVEIKGFVVSGVERRRDNQKGEVSLTFVDRSYMLKNQFVACLPYYDGWGDISAILDLLQRAGYISQSNVSSYMNIFKQTALDDGVVGEKQAGYQLSLGTQRGPIWDFKMGTAFWECLQKIAGYTKQWFYLTREGKLAYVSPLKLLYIFRNALGSPMQPGTCAVIVPSTSQPWFTVNVLRYREKPEQWYEEIRNLTYSEEFDSSYNLYALFGATPAWLPGYQVNPFAAVLGDREPKTDTELLGKIGDPNEYNGTNQVYFPFKKIAMITEPELNNLRVIRQRLEVEKNRLFAPATSVSFSTWGWSFCQPLSLIYIEESDEPKVISSISSSGGGRGKGWFLVSKVTHSMDVTRKDWAITVNAERWYDDEDYFFKFYSVE